MKIYIIAQDLGQIRALKDFQEEIYQNKESKSSSQEQNVQS